MTEKGIQKKKPKVGIFVALSLVIVMISTMFMSPAQVAYGRGGVSDLGSQETYSKIFQNTSTESAGRVWSDKSVYSNQTMVDGKSIPLTEGENFNVVYSLLGSSQKITGKGETALDVVFILDTSGSMENSAGNKTRIEAAVDAINHSMDTLLTDNPYNRVGVATFATDSSVLMNLDNYKAKYVEAWDETKEHWLKPDEIIHHPAHYEDFISFDGSKVKATWDTGSNSVDFKGGTNTQLGFKTGMDLLTNETSTTTTIKGKTVQRVPVVVMLSDGASTYSVKGEDGNWWNPSKNADIQGPGNEAYYGNGMLAMMTASYKKQEISKNYNVSGTALDTRVYTIGLGVGGLKGEEKALAQITLDPTTHWNYKNQKINNKIREEWKNYTSGNNITIKVDSSKNYTVKHPSSNDITSLEYVNQYFEPETATDLDEVFEGIVNDIIASAPDYPTDLQDVTDPTKAGYVTYTDPIGEYMEVKDVKSIIIDGQEYHLTEPVVSGNTTTYKGSGTVKDPVTGGDVNLNNVTVTIKKDENNNQTLTAKIPAAAIPLKINDVKLDKNGAVTNNDVTSVTPLRLVYSVGLSEGVDTLKGVSKEYIEKNITSDGQVNFYSNLFAGKTDGSGNTIGDAYTSFTPAKDNPNYYFQSDAVIYKDKALKNPVKQGESFDSSKKYYIGTPYYVGNEVKTSLVERTGDAFIEAIDNGYITIVDGNQALKAGTPRNYHIEQDFAVRKSENTTNTAEMLYSPKVTKAGVVINDITFNHGNNGVIEVEAPKSLIVKKIVTSPEGVPAPDEEFTFEITIDSLKDKTVTAKVTTGAETVDKEVVFDGTGKTTVNLKANEYITIPNVTGAYKVTEIELPNGFTTTMPNNAEGTVGTTEDVTVTFENKYNVTPVVIEDIAQFGFPIQKTLTNRNFKDTDKFTFVITGPEGAMPEKTTAVIDGANIKDQAVAEVDFGKFTFNKPGTYEYIISEEAGNIPGITYDPIKYKLTVVIKDTEGKLSFESSKLERSAGNDTWIEVNPADKISFTNKYEAKSQEIAISGTKILNNKDLNDYAEQFKFFIEKVGNDESQPMPVIDTVTCDKITGKINFTGIRFGTEHIGKEYTYKITEAQPTDTGKYDGKPLDGATKDKQDNWVYKGVTFDHSEKTVTVNVISKELNGESVVVANVEGNDFEFTNTYNAEKDYIFTNVDGGESATKFIEGRTFKEGDTFTFDITTTVDNGEVPDRAKLPEEIKVTPEIGKTEYNFGFGNVHFTQEDAGKTYTYTFKERTGNLDGMTYDETVKSVSLTIVDKNDGTLDIIRTGDEKLSWTNKYTSNWSDESGVSLYGNKSLKGAELQAGNFTFKVEGVDNAPLKGVDPGKENAIYIVNDLNGVFNILEDQTYTMEDLGGNVSKTFVYKVTEVKPETPQKGVTYDDSVYEVHVKVTDDLKGNIAVGRNDVTIYKVNTAEKEKVNSVEFVNKYKPEETTITPFVDGTSLLHKQLVGPRITNLKADEFKFTFEPKKATLGGEYTVVNEGEVGNKAPTEENSNIADVTFDKSNITFTKPGEYTFVIKEVTVNLPEGITCKTPEIEVTYTVVDDNGQLVATPKVTNNGVFVNEYNTTGIVDGSTTLEVTKEIDGRKWKDTDKFKFTIKAYDDATQKHIDAGHITFAKDTVEIEKNTQGHKASFGDITIKYPGTFNFVVSESAEGLAPGMNRDGVNRIVTVTATDKGNGTMDVVTSIAADKETASAEGKDNLTFTNVYAPDETVLAGDGNLSVRKELDGRPWLGDDAFTFTLTGGDEATKAAIGKDIILGDDAQATSITITNNSVNQTESFSDITFKKDGRFVFDIVESNPEKPGVSYVETAKKLYVDVTLNADGTLTAKVDTKNSDKLTFTNNYTPVEGKLDGQANLTVTKEITGREWLEGETFTFEITAADEVTKNTENVVLPTETIITVDGTTKTNSFGDITFKQPGTYKFDVVEKLPEGTVDGANGLTYDTAVRRIVVDVKDNYDGKPLVVTKNENLSSSLAFTNKYVPTQLTYDGATYLQVKKLIEGRKWQPGDKFAFTLSYDANDEFTENAYKEGTLLLPTSTILNIEYKEGTKDTEYKGNFGDITFKKAGTYKFVINEVKENIGGITYDETSHTFEVTVTDDGKGNLSATQTGPFVFTNKYSANPVIFPAQGSGDLQVTKVFNGRPWNENDSFTFNMEPIGTYEEGSFELGATTCTVKGTDLTKVASFGDITFNKPGEYEFKITEVIPEGEKHGITYDNSSKRVTVNVWDDGKGKLHADVSEGSTDTLIFTNTYKPSDLVIIPTQDPKDDGMIGIKLNKILKGREWKEGDSFSFKIEALDGAPATSKTECTVTKPNQMFDFGILTITQADMKGATEKTFRYKVTEIIPENPTPGVKYDTTPIIFTVRASDNGEGFLIAGNGQPDSGLIINEADGTNKGEFVNTYTPSETALKGEENLKVVKNFTGRDGNAWTTDDKFTFQITVSDPETNKAIQSGDVVLPENASGITIDKDTVDYTKAFGDITFKKAGTYKFDIGEINQTIAGVDYASKQTVVVEVIDNNNGELIATVTEDTKVKPFENIYKADQDTLSGIDYLNVVKKLTGREWLDGESYTFEIAANNEATQEAITDGNIVMPEVTTLTIDNTTVGHTKHFDNITFKKAGEYEFKVTEKVPDGAADENGVVKLNGVTYDTEDKIIKVTVTDLGKGKLEATAPKGGVTFTNQYTHEDAVLKGDTYLNVTKKLLGREWKDGETFKFRMFAGNTLAKDVVLPEDIAIGKEGTGSFADIKFEKPGEYIFYIREIIPDEAEKAAGVIYDRTLKRIDVIVEDNLDGTMTAKAEPSSVEFTNSYKAVPVTVSGTANLKVKKVLNGRPFEPGDVFAFELKPDEATQAKNTETNTAFELPSNADELIISYGNTAKEKSFGNIKFNEAGTYKFNITEKKGTINNITYDSTVYTVTVEVTDNTETGKLEATVSGLTDNTATFTNTYKPDPVTLEGKTNLKVAKVIDGRDWMEGDNFSFTISPAKDYGDKVVMSDSKVSNIQYNEDGNYETYFEDITFTEAGTYEFIIEENVPETPIPGMTYAGPNKVTVKVTDDNNGTLTAVVVGTRTSTFTNKYTTEPGILIGEENLEVEKIFEGKNWADEVFTFTITPISNNKANVVNGTQTITISKADIVENGITGTDVDTKSVARKAFEDITFNKVGTYTFVITETAGDTNNITYADNKAVVTVDVTDMGKGQLELKLNTEGTNPLVFTNIYDPSEVVIGPSGDTGIQLKKVLNGRTLTKDDKWTFTITAAVGTPLPAKTEVTNDENGNVTFGDITYTKPGVYEYVITESGKIAGVTNDEVAQANVTVNVTYDGDKGVLASEVTYDKDTFTNSYNVEPAVLSGKTDLEVKKALTGREWMTGDKFFFNIVAADDATIKAVEAGDVVLPNELEINSENADADQYKVNHFDDITFKKAGTYKFNITENVNPYIAGVTNDTTVKTLTVNVEDNLDGTLTVTKDAKNSTELVFTNTYKPASVTLAAEDAFAFEKAFVGREWSENDKFTFTLEAKDGADIPMPEKSEVTLTIDNVVDNNAAFDFGSITYTDEDLGETRTKAFTYVVKEVVPEDTKEITYDALERLVTITVTDDGTGQLKTNVAVEGEKVFTNTYGTAVKYGDAKGNTPATITKILENHELADGQFTFTVKALDEDGTGRSAAKLNEVGGIDGVMTVTNAPAKMDADGNATWHTNPFDSMVFVNNSEKKEAGTYSYEIAEVQETKAGYTYDKSTYKVTITVTYDEATGKLDVNTVGGNAVFYNKYEAKGTLGGNADGAVKINATKTLNGREMSNGEFTFEVVNTKLPENKNVVATGTNKGTEQGSLIEFSEINYSLENIEESGYESKEIVNGNAVYTYSYIVREGQVSDGITKATPSFNITVKVTDNGEGKLVPEVKYPEKTGSLDFVNTYNADSVDINIAATKKLVTPDGALVTLEDIAGKYEFVIEAAGAEYTPLVVEPEVEPEPEVIEPEVIEPEVTEPEVTEPEVIEPEVTEAEEVVEPASEEAKPVEETEEIGEEIVADELSMELPVQTEEETKEEQIVTYKVVAAQEVKPIANPLPAKITATNDEIGNIEFAPITFDLTSLDGVQPAEDGSRTIKFTYKVSERNTVDGITNDPNPKTFTVTVVDNGKGQISANVDNAELEKLVFENTYKFTPGTSSLTGSGQFNIIKNLEGRALRDAEFKFELKDLEGNVVATGKNDENGTVAMSEVQFEKPGIYQYSLSEVYGGQKLDNAVEYDETVYEVTATVTDLKNGTLNVEWAVKDVEKDIVFTNVYNPKATAVTLGANKILSGRPLKDGEFTFVLKDENGNELQTVKNDKNGRIRFDKIIYDKAGTWKYTVEEVKGTEKNMKYDDTVYELTVNIIDDGIGFLRPELINENGYVVFHNIYEKPAEPVKPVPPVKPETPVKPSKPSGHKPPKTGDTNEATVWAVIMMAAAGAAVVAGKKRKNK